MKLGGCSVDPPRCKRGREILYGRHSFNKAIIRAEEVAFHNSDSSVRFPR